MQNIPNKIAKWTIATDFVDRMTNKVFKFIQLAIFCKVFNMNKYGYIITAVLVIVVYLGLAWLLDKTHLREKIQERSAMKSGAWLKLLERLDRAGIK